MLDDDPTAYADEYIVKKRYEALVRAALQQHGSRPVHEPALADAFEAV